MSINDILDVCGKIIERKKKLEVPITIGLKPTAKEFILPSSIPVQEKYEEEYNSLCIDNDNIEYDRIDDCLIEFDKIKRFYFDDEEIEELINDFWNNRNSKEAVADKYKYVQPYADRLDSLQIFENGEEIDRASKILRKYAGIKDE